VLLGGSIGRGKAWSREGCRGSRSPTDSRRAARQRFHAGGTGASSPRGGRAEDRHREQGWHCRGSKSEAVSAQKRGGSGRNNDLQRAERSRGHERGMGLRSWLRLQGKKQRNTTGPTVTLKKCLIRTSKELGRLREKKEGNQGNNGYVTGGVAGEKTVSLVRGSPKGKGPRVGLKESKE